MNPREMAKSFVYTARALIGKLTGINETIHNEKLALACLKLAEHYKKYMLDTDPEKPEITKSIHYTYELINKAEQQRKKQQKSLIQMYNELTS